MFEHVVDEATGSRAGAGAGALLADGSSSSSGGAEARGVLVPLFLVPSGPLRTRTTTVITFRTNPSHNLTRSPVHIFILLVSSELVCSETKRLVCSVMGVLATEVTARIASEFQARSEAMRNEAKKKRRGGANKPRSGPQCKRCHNRDPKFFRHDFVKSNTVCTKCGAQLDASELFEGEWARTFEDSSVDRQQYGMAPDRLLSEASNFQTRMERTTEELSDFQKGIMEAMRRADANQDRLGQERGGARTKNATKDEDIKWARMQATAIQSKLQLKHWARKESWALDMFARCVASALMDGLIDARTPLCLLLSARCSLLSSRLAPIDSFLSRLSID